MSSNEIRVDRLSSLANAADTLAKAAATLSEAARAAAEAFSSELTNLSSQLNGIAELASGVAPITSNKLDDEPPVEIPKDYDEPAFDTAEVSEDEEEFEDEECTNPEDSDYYASDDDTNATSVKDAKSDGPTLDRPRSDSKSVPPVVSEPEITTDPQQAYRILVDKEADVLLVVCALILKRRKVVCYMNCSIPAFNLYKKIINDVTDTAVHTITKITPGELIQVGESFLEPTHSVLLLPETLAPSIKIEEQDSWVIHVGWPSNEQLYEDQRNSHQAQNNILVAYSGDEKLYPTGAAIMWQSKPWPRDVDSFKASVTTLRPVFEKKLVDVPPEMKEKVYPDWISCHSSRGHRWVKSWDPSALVTRANSFLLDVLRYKPASFRDAESKARIPLPEVSPGFVAHHGLEEAVKQGILRVKASNDSGINHISALPKKDFAFGSISANDVLAHEARRNEGAALGALNNLAGNKPPAASEWGRPTASDWGSPAVSVPPSVTDDPPKPRVVPQPVPARPPSQASVMTRASISDRPAGTPTTGQTSFTRSHLIIEQEFDLIPSMCQLSSAAGVRNVVCFVKSLTCIEPLMELMKGVIGKAMFLAKGHIPLTPGASIALRTLGGCVLFCDTYAEIPAYLKSQPIDTMVHLGWMDNVEMYKNHTNMKSLKVDTVIIARREVQDPNGPQLIASLGQAGVPPADAETKRQYNRQTEGGAISLERRLWKASLLNYSAMPQVRAWYMTWITHHYLGRHKQMNWSAIDVVTNANRTLMSTLLHGSGKTEGLALPRPSVTRGYVKHLGLEDAVAAGVLLVQG